MKVLKINIVITLAVVFALFMGLASAETGMGFGMRMQGRMGPGIDERYGQDDWANIRDDGLTWPPHLCDTQHANLLQDGTHAIHVYLGITVNSKQGAPI